MPDEGFTELAGPRVAVRRFHPGDVAGFVAYRWSVPVARFQGWDAPFPRGGGRALCPGAGDRASRYARGMVRFAVALRPDGQLTGDCAAMPQAGDSGQCEIGFTIAPGVSGARVRHRGGAVAAGLLVHHAGQAPGHRLLRPAECASVALLERLGMRREGHLRQSTWAKGEWTDDLVYALLHDEWQSG